MSALITLAMLACLTQPVAASDSGTQTITFQVLPINEIAIQGAPKEMHAAAGSEAIDTSTTYAISTNQDDRKIIVALDEAPPEGVILKVNLAAPSGATSLGDVVLSTAPADAVVGISRLAEKGLPITYRLSVATGETDFTPGNAVLTLVGM